MIISLLLLLHNWNNYIAENEWTHQGDVESQYPIHIKHLLQPIHFVRACLCVLDH